MSNLVDKLIPRVDLLRQKFADKFGLPAYDLYQIVRTWDGGEVGAGNVVSSVVTKINPTPKITFKGGEILLTPGRHEDRTMQAVNTSLTYTENFLQGDPKAPGVEVFFKLVERNGQAADTTTWILSGVPQAQRNKIGWLLDFKHYHTQLLAGE
jgi:hypothetical protein